VTITDWGTTVDLIFFSRASIILKVRMSVTRWVFLSFLNHPPSQEIMALAVEEYVTQNICNAGIVLSCYRWEGERGIKWYV
jgi:hypothetical protein